MLSIKPRALRSDDNAHNNRTNAFMPLTIYINHSIYKPVSA